MSSRSVGKAVKKTVNDLWRVRKAQYDTLNALTSWPLVDLEIVQRSSAKLVPPFYELKALRWLVQELQDSPSMIPHLQNTLITLPLHLVMPAVFDQWFFHPKRDWTRADIGAALQAALQPPLLRQGIDSHKTNSQAAWLNEHTKQDSKLFHQFLHYYHILVKGQEHYDWGFLVTEWEKIWKQLEPSPQSQRAPVGPPFSFKMLDRILKDPGLNYESFNPWLLKFCTPPSTDRDHAHAIKTDQDHSLAINYLAQHITTASTPQHQTYGSPAAASPFLRSEACCNLMKQIHDSLLHSKRPLGSTGAYRWLEATDIIRHTHALPADFFPPLPHYFPIPLPRLEDSLWALPDEPSDSDFGLLHSCQNHWTKVDGYEKAHFIEILSKYINNFPILRVLHYKHTFNTPLLTHRRGLEFIGFLYVQVEDHVLLSRSMEDAWLEALERVRVANKWSPAILTMLPDSRRPRDISALQPIEGDSTSAEEFSREGDRGIVEEGSSRDREAVEGKSSNEEAVESSALMGSAGGSGGGDISHTSRDNDSVGGVGADNNV
ncbi:hypothetical protein V5O48_004544 [Marasmius crinis-equi]|uniref:Uncharacterized protein n=1 Tax=Marasmius crinis-equi TaxID=585013 RepID=A0ABR3FPR0_9AGAR